MIGQRSGFGTADAARAPQEESACPKSSGGTEYLASGKLVVPHIPRIIT
jgi:hypothetical protein